ncbi:ABC transporter substrate-binding protein [Bosea sp. (in: a-proteobacteria)]|uniref:ABC transporter substrate-binding protein n=1 Tax=Bosea sp. (in: a-proteobacteria) TaxID=1871050 RepID=UPI00344FB694
MKRRTFLQGSLAASAAASLPRFAVAQPASVLKFIPGASLAILDPIANTSAPTRLHGFMVYDTLYGLDSNFAPQPQMAEGHEVSADGLDWTIKLRDGLFFHDGEPVRAKDVVASLNRWSKRDTFGKTLFSRTNELLAVDDKTVRFRLKRPFALLPAALGKVGSNIAVIMPERLALTDPSKAVTEVIGSGPFSFVAKDYSPGALVAYEKFKKYTPRASGEVGFSSGPKTVHFDRVEWHVIPDGSTALAAIQSGEMDWWESPLPDFLPIVQGNPSMKIVPAGGQVMFLRLNHLYPPFNNPEIRRILLSCIDRKSIMQAVGGGGEWRDDIGLYLGSMKTDAGIKEAFRGRTDFDNVKSELAAAGYKGERMVMLVGTDTPRNLAASQVAESTFKKMGLNVDFQSLDWGTVSQRRASMEPPEKGGWACFFVGADSEYFLDPATNFLARANGRDGWFGWPDSSRIEQLTEEWFNSTDVAAQKEIASQIQLQAWKDIPYVPIGEVQAPGLARSNLQGFAPGFAKFWGVKRT